MCPSGRFDPPDFSAQKVKKQTSKRFEIQVRTAHFDRGIAVAGLRNVKEALPGSMSKPPTRSQFSKCFEAFGFLHASRLLREPREVGVQVD